jgi:hypothetical protein
MNITLIKLRGVTVELRGIRTQLERIADCMEMELAQNGVNMRPPKADTSGPEPTITYVDEELDWARETVERYKREDAAKAEDDGE